MRVKLVGDGPTNRMYLLTVLTNCTYCLHLLTVPTDCTYQLAVQSDYGYALYLLIVPTNCTCWLYLPTVLTDYSNSSYQLNDLTLKRKKLPA